MIFIANGGSWTRRVKIWGVSPHKIAVILRGKNKPIFAPNIDVGDYVVVINAEHITVTGTRLDDKVYNRHSHYIGGLTSVTLRDQLIKHPDRRDRCRS